MAQNRNKSSISAEDIANIVRLSEYGVIRRHYLHQQWRSVNEAIGSARKDDLIKTYNDLIYDPQRLDQEKAISIAEQGELLDLPDFAEVILEMLQNAGVPALAEQDIQARLGSYFSRDLVDPVELALHGIQHLSLRLFDPYKDWYYLESASYDEVYSFALNEAERRYQEEWREVLEWAGDDLRIGSNEGDSLKAKALARLYSRKQVEALLDVPRRLLRVMMDEGHLPRRVCPDGAQRFRAEDIHRLRQSPQMLQAFEDQTDINLKQLRNLTGLKVNDLKTILHNAGLRPAFVKQKGPKSNAWYRWGEVRPVFWPQGDHPTVADIDLVEASGSGQQAWWSDRILELQEEIEERRRKQREARDRRREEMRERREALRTQMIDNFPSWLRDPDLDQTAYIHVGPTNSGKTHDALQELAVAGSGWYLAPLRLLARENFERLNRMGVYCSLLTGEERIDVPGATITSATVEMFNPGNSGECVVVDEAHLVADDQRGWAWTRALMHAQAPQLRVITAPHGLNFLSRFFDTVGVETQVLHHHRMVPLSVAPEVWSLRNLPPRTILVAFSRKDVLRLKYTLQRMGRSVAVVYGALPPEVRLKQAERFAQQEVEICVATDAVGMGLNLPADNVVFSTLTKFDGKQMRRLYPGEVQQIGGRAGRYGLSTQGYVGGVDRQILGMIHRMLERPVPDVRAARIAPRTDEIELLEGDLSQRLSVWTELNAIPEDLRDLITSTDMDERIELSRMLSYDDLRKLGVDQALTLVNAPVRPESQEYWVECATAILRDQPLPLPPPSPAVISEGFSLKQAETVIACIDIYLWLGYREPFQHLVEDPAPVMQQREDLILKMDLALMKRFNPDIRRGRNNGNFNPYS